MSARRSFCLGALLLLVVNDHILKVVWPCWITGKLSDFAGVFALAMFLEMLVARSAACALAAALFVWWKSPLSQPVIDALPWQASRAVDWTDLIALAVLVPAYRLMSRPRERDRARVALAVLSVVAFVATTRPRTDVDLNPSDPRATIRTCSGRDAVLDSFNRCGMKPALESRGGVLRLRVSLPVDGKHRGMFIYVSVSADGAITLHSIQLFGRVTIAEEAVRTAVYDRLAQCASKCR